MADLIGKFDEHEALTMGWHGKTNVRELITTEDNHLTRHDIQSVGLFLPNGKPAVAEVETDDDGNVIAEHQWSLLGYTDTDELTTGKPFNPNTFRPFSNKEFLDIVRDAIAGIGGKIESVLSCDNRSKIAISVQLDQVTSYKIGDRVFEAYLSFILGRDMACPLVVKTGNVCIVCANTYAAALSSGGKNVNASIKQTKNGRKKIANLAEIVDAAIGVQAQFKAAFESLASVPVRHSEAKAVFTGFLMPEFDRSELSDSEAADFALATRTGNRVDRLLELFHDDSKGNGRGTRADLFSAGTDFYSHESAGKDVWKQVRSSEFGSAAREKGRLFEVVTSPDNYAATLARGEAILQLC